MPVGEGAKRVRYLEATFILYTTCVGAAMQCIFRTCGDEPMCVGAFQRGATIQALLT